MSQTSKQPKNFIKNNVYPAEWKETIIPEQPEKKCNHFFEFTDIARCIRCGLGLYGVVEIKDGKPII